MSGLDVAQWVAPAAQSLINVMLGDAWATLRDRFARILSPREGDTTEVVEELDESRQRLLDAIEGDGTHDEVIAEWRSRFRRALTRDPELLDDLKSIMDQVRGEGAGDPAGIQQHVTADGNAVVFNQGSGTQHNTINRG